MVITESTEDLRQEENLLECSVEENRVERAKGSEPESPNFRERLQITFLKWIKSETGQQCNAPYPRTSDWNGLQGMTGLVILLPYVSTN